MQAIYLFTNLLILFLVTACGGRSAPNTEMAVLNDTGVTTCINGDWQVVACADASALKGQDALAGRDAKAQSHQLNKTGAGAAGFDFTKLDVQGQPLANQTENYAVAPWQCVRDNHTGLVWEIKNRDPNSAYYFNHTYSWYNPRLQTEMQGTVNGGSCLTQNCDTASYIAAANQVALCGQLQWRLPSVTELLSIADQNASNPPLDVNYFPNSSLNAHWSAQTAAFKPDFAWYVYFTAAGNGLIAKSGQAHIRLVSGKGAGDE